MIFAHPYLLLLIPLLAAGGVWLFRSSRERARRKLAKFSPAGRLPNMLGTVDFRAKRLKFILTAASLCLLALVLARPLWGPRQDSKPQEGAEFFIILDVSKSMLVRDVAPCRLDSVKASLSEWLKTRGGDRIGLILMSGDAFIQAPLTNDYTALREVLAQSSTKSLSLGGTNISEAIKVADKALNASGVKNKALVIISDGENTEGSTLAEVQRAHTEERISFFTVGVGTADGGPVPNKELPADFAGPVKEIVRDEYGLPVTSKLDERNLRAIASAGGGKYFTYAPDGRTWDSLYNQALSSLARKSAVFKLEDYMDLFQIPLLLVILLLAWEYGISTRHKKPARPVSMVTLPEPSPAPAATIMDSTAKFTAPALVLFLTLTGISWGAREVDPLLAKTEVMMKEGRAGEAAAMLLEATKSRPEDAYLMYNYGIAAYAAKQYQEASDAFSEVCLSPDKKLRSQALTQLGNTHYRIGQAVTKSGNRGGAAVAWERSVEYYRSANEEKPTKASKENLKIAEDQLEKLLLEMGDKSVLESRKTENLQAQINHLTKAHEAYDKVSTLKPENTEARSKKEETARELSGKLADQARALREKSAKVPEGKNQTAEQDKLNVQASQAYQQARDLAPRDKPLEEEHEAFKDQVADKMTDNAQALLGKAMEPTPEAPRFNDLKKKQDGLQKALEQTTKALAFDETNQRAADVQSQVLKNLEETHVALADMSKAAGEQNEARKNAEAASENFNGALQNYQKALAINPENAHAEAALSEVQEKLAANMTEVGKKEMAQVGAPPKKGEKPLSEVGQLREDIGHLEKAAQNFSQAEALDPGKNDAQALQEQAAAQLNELRGRLDQAQAKAGEGETPPGAEGEPTPSDQPGQKEGKEKGQAMTAMKPMLSFSEIRGGTEREGQFKDLSNKRRIRDW